MSNHGLTATLDLLRRVIDLEQRQGYKNRAAAGGLYRYFEQQFARHDYDEQTATLAQGILGDLKRYEEATALVERSARLEVVRRRLDAPQRVVDDRIGPVDPTHRGDAGALARVRGDNPRMPGPIASDPGTVSEGATGKVTGHEPGSGRTPGRAGRSAAPRRAADAASHGPRDTSPAIESTSGTPAKASSLQQPLRDVVKIRPQELEKLERLGVRTVEQAIYHLPRDHYDYRNPVPMHQLRPGMTTTLVGVLTTVNVRRTPRKLTIVEARIKDKVAEMRVSWFNDHMGRVLRPRVGQRIAVSGHTELYNGRLKFVPRDYEFPDEDDGLHTMGLVPIYPLTEGLTQRWLRGTIRKALEAGLSLVEDPLPAGVRATYRLPALAEALAWYHVPDDHEQRSGAQRRLAFDELLCVSIGMAQRRREWRSGAPARAIARDDVLLARFQAALPFALTGAQQRVLGQIIDDMGAASPMNRLLQGDVGSGKTVVAACALLLAAHSGLQGAIMAPTEILAEQHYRSMTRLLEPFGVRVALLTGSVKGQARRDAYAAVAAGDVGVVVGTHALIQEGVVFDRLALAVVDEQHRFGVEQRGRLRQKGYNPHLLAMTATPIPRTLTLTIYGDLDVSVIDERPPGRLPVETRVEQSEARVYDVVRAQAAEGRQAYIVCALVEESDETGDGDGVGRAAARAAVAEQKRLQREVFPDLTVGLLHGKMKPAEKEKTLAAFRDGHIQVLVATSVVEVGIDVPNATVMVVQDANRFGLAQLHQFRGRVGRGADRSFCLLLAESASSVGQQRLTAIAATDDGFALAEEDLRLRGPGEFLGTRQSGLPGLMMAEWYDMRTVAEARAAADTILSSDAELRKPEHQLLALRVQQFWHVRSDVS